VTLRPFRPGRGWLILIGGSNSWPPTEQIDREAIARMDKSKRIAFLPAANCPPDYAESFLATYTRLGAPEGYEVPIRDPVAARDPKNAELLANAGLIYLGGGDTEQLLASMAGSPALDAVASAYDQGAVIAGTSAGAIALAAWGVSLNAGVLRGWGWLTNTIVSVHHAADRDRLLGQALQDHPDAIGIALPEHAALAIGPDGEQERWGEPGITITPGAQHEPD
jgi:cyanophycinase